MAPVDTYVDPSKASDAGSSPLTSEKSQGQKESDSSDAVSAAQEGPESDGGSGNPEGQNQSGGKDVDREKKRGSPRGHDQNRNRPRGVCGKELTLHTCAGQSVFATYGLIRHRSHTPIDPTQHST